MALPAPGQRDEILDDGTNWPQSEAGESFSTLFSDKVTGERIFHVDYLKSKFTDFARPNLYRIEFWLPESLTQDFDFLSAENKVKTEMMCKTSMFPQFEITRQEIRRMGMKVSLPAATNYGDLQVTIMADDQYTQRKFLHAWMKRLVYDTDNNYLRKISTTLSCKIRMYQLDNNFDVVMCAIFDNAWPTNLGEVQLSFDSDSQLIEFPVTFTYSTYTIETPEAD